MPATVADPALGAISVPSVRTVVVLPAPFGPEEAEHLAVGDLERDVLERHPVAEPLRQTVCRQRWSAAVRTRSSRAR